MKQVILILLIMISLVGNVSSLGVEYQSGIVCETSSIKCVDYNTQRICSDDGTSYEDIKCSGWCKVNESGVGECIQKEIKETNYLVWIITWILLLILIFVLVRKKK